MESLGEYLKREREFRKISLQEISQKTKIREKILRDLEGGQIDSIESPVFVKGYLKAYARYVGLDPEDVVLRYEASLKKEETPPPPPKKPVEDTPKQWSLRYIVLPVSVLLLLGILLFLTLQKPMKMETHQESPEETKAAALPVPTLKSDQPTPMKAEDVSTPTVASRKRPMVIPPPIHPLRRSTSPSPPRPIPGIELELAALEDTWIQIQIDETPATEIFLRPGEVISRRGEQYIDIKIGNAGGLRVVHNGEDLGRLGDSGEVIYLSISPDEVKMRGSSGLIRQTPEESTAEP